MAKRKSRRPRPAIPKIDSAAISIRSGACGPATVLFDESFGAELTGVGFNLLPVIFRQAPQAEHDMLSQWAGAGKWLAVASDPEILDADGVPNLDLVFTKTVQNSPPEMGFWFDPLVRLLDVPSGMIRVVYDEGALNSGDLAEAGEFTIHSSADEDLRDHDYAESGSYLIPCEPGFYQASIFTGYIDDACADEDAPPELAIFLTPVRKPKKLKPVPPLVPIHSPEQDVYSVQRRALGLPPLSKKVRDHQPKLMKNGSFRGKLIQHELLGLVLDMPQELQQQFGFEPGQIVTIDIDEPEPASLHGILSSSAGINPTVWELVDQQKRKADNFAVCTSRGDRVFVELIKQSSKSPFELVEGDMTLATMKHVAAEADAGKPAKVPTKQSAVGHRKAMEIPKRVGQPGPCVEALFPLMEVCQSWTQACLFEVDGKTLIGAVQVFPPQRLVNRLGEEVTMAAEIHATIGTVEGGVTVHEEPRKFRGFPQGVERAFKWVAAQAKGGWLWTNRFELTLERQHGQKLDRKTAQAAAIAAWKEVLGIADTR